MAGWLYVEGWTEGGVPQKPWRSYATRSQRRRCDEHPGMNGQNFTPRGEWRCGLSTVTKFDEQNPSHVVGTPLPTKLLRE